MADAQGGGGRRRGLSFVGVEASAPIAGGRDMDDAMRERVAARREELLSEKRTQLAKLVEEHDGAVRELFHLDRFVSLVSFNPEEAKKDTSQVFETFRARFDLFRLAAAPVAPAGVKERRTTRGAVDNLRQQLGGPSQSPPVSSSKPTESKAGPSTVSGKGRGRGRHASTSSLHAHFAIPDDDSGEPPNDALDSTPAPSLPPSSRGSARGRGRGRARVSMSAASTSATTLDTVSAEESGPDIESEDEIPNHHPAHATNGHSVGRERPTGRGKSTIKPTKSLSSRGKGKGRAVANHEEEADELEEDDPLLLVPSASSSRGRGRGRGKATRGGPRKSLPNLNTLTINDDDEDEFDRIPPSSTSVRARGNARGRGRGRGARASLPTRSEDLEEVEIDLESQDEEDIPSSDNEPGPSTTRGSGRGRGRGRGRGAAGRWKGWVVVAEGDTADPDATPPTFTNGHTSEDETSGSPSRNTRPRTKKPPTETPTRPLKRIKLIHKVPDPTYTHHQQIPDRKKLEYPTKIPELLRSYYRLEDDGSEMKLEELEALAAEEGETFARFTRLRLEGRLNGPIQGPVKKQILPQRQLDAWDELLERIPVQAKIVKAWGNARDAQIKKVVKVMTTHWTMVAGAEERAAKAEEKRAKDLSRATLKIVKEHWKNAIRVVRQKKLDEAKAEQARLGKEHFDAIIEHSAQALQAQRNVGLRDSHSVSSAHDSDTPSEESDDDDEDEEVDDSEEDQPDEDDNELDDREITLDGLLEVKDSDDEDLENEDEGEIVVASPPPMSESLLTDASVTPSESRRSLSIDEDTPLPPPAKRRRVSFKLDDDAHPTTDTDAGDTPEAAPELSHSPSPPTATNGNQNGTHLDDSSPSALSPAPTPPTDDATSMHPRKRKRVNGAAEADEEFTSHENDQQDEEDNQLAAEMEADEADSDDGELNALEQDADIPLEELLKQYGYVPREEGDEDDDGDEADEDNDGADVDGELGQNDDATDPPIENDPPDPDISPTPDTKLASSEAPSPSHIGTTITNDTLTLPPNGSPVPVVSKVPSPSLNSTELEPAAIPMDVDDTVPKPQIDNDGPSLDAAVKEESESEAESESSEEVNSDNELPSLAQLVSVQEDPSIVKPPFLLRGSLRPYQHAGLEWLVSLYAQEHNGILADEMGLGKTIQTIALLAWLACEKGIWGPHLIVVPTSVLKNWEMEFKKFLPGFKIMSYYGTVRERKEKRHGWKGQNAFHVCITSYNLILTDQHIFRRMPWVYMILDEAHNIKNFKSQRWQDLFTFRPHRRLLLTGTPLQNNLMELWALMHFLNPVDAVGYRADFADWFSKPMDRALEDGRERDDENQERVTKLHTMLRPYLLRRMKADVEKELPAKYEHLVYCKLSKRQRFLYDEFMARSETKEILSSGNFLSVVNCLMQLRKVCNHPDLFEVRPIVTSFAMRESAVADFEDKELLIRRHLLASSPFDGIHPAFSQITSHEHLSFNASTARRLLDGSSHLPGAKDLPGEPPPRDFRTIDGFRRWSDHQKSEAKYGRWRHITYLNRQRCAVRPLYGSEILTTLASIATSRQRLFGQTSSPHPHYMETTSMLLGAVKSYRQRTDSVHPLINTFAFATPPVVARDISSLILRAVEQPVAELAADPNFDILHLPAVKLQIAFPDRSLLQYDCGKLQQLDALLKERKAGGHRALIFTQMTKVLDILEIFLNFHGYRYLRLDGSTKIEDRQKITQRFNMDTRILCFISSSRSGGVGINLTGADTVIFYDSDFNPSMDRQCEDRAHRIGQIRDVHIYRFISKHTVEESMLRKANQKRSLDDMVIRDGDFDWRKMLVSDIQMEQALDQVEDAEDAQAARYAAAEIYQDTRGEQQEFDESGPLVARQAGASAEEGAAEEDEGEEEDDGLTGLERYVLRMVEEDWSYFSEWRFK